MATKREVAKTFPPEKTALNKGDPTHTRTAVQCVQCCGCKIHQKFLTCWNETFFIQQVVLHAKTFFFFGERLREAKRDRKGVKTPLSQ